ncbi:MAG: response regulator [Ktedonobacteraceae bacterium]|nr:response regulator [Ktedonobacteraceae bacterium]
MSNVWSILVVEADEHLNRTIVNTLHNDGYTVQSVVNGADAARMLWSDEFAAVICDVKIPGVGSFELVQWLRAYRPNTQIIMLGEDNAEMRMQALENGAISYLEKPLNVRLLKEDLWHLLRMPGFSADLDSFDLLDVIQMVAMSRRNIALLVNSGLEGHGLLCFQNGELIWAEYGELRGNEAFFALAAHKNGTVMQQPWREQVVPNVTLPLSRLIFQAVQFRARNEGEGATVPQHSAEYTPMVSSQFVREEVDDSPFGIVAESSPPSPVPHTSQIPYMSSTSPVAPVPSTPQMPQGMNSQYEEQARSARQGMAAIPPGGESKEWWQKTGGFPRLEKSMWDEASGTQQQEQSERGQMDASPTIAISDRQLNGEHIQAATSRPVPRTPREERYDLPSWLTEQPTASEMPVVRTASSRQMPAVPASFTSSTSSTSSVPTPTSQDDIILPSVEWQEAFSLQPDLERSPAMSWNILSPAVEQGQTQITSPVWHPAQSSSPMPPVSPLANSMELLQPVAEAQEVRASLRERRTEEKNESAVLARQKNGERLQLAEQYNYPALVSALQTLGYAISGFVAAALVSMDGQPIAQVAIDDLDISPVCHSVGGVLQSALQTLEQGKWGDLEDMVITGAERRILIRLVGNEYKAFQVLITMRDTSLTECLEVMVNVESAINAALG